MSKPHRQKQTATRSRPNDPHHPPEGEHLRCHWCGAHAPRMACYHDEKGNHFPTCDNCAAAIERNQEPNR